MAHLRMVYYDGGKTTTSTQSSLTNKALLIKYFVVSSIAKSFCLLSHYYPDMSITVGESYSAWQQKLKKRSGFWYRRVWLEKGRQLTRSQKRKKTPTIVQSAGNVSFFWKKILFRWGGKKPNYIIRSTINTSDVFLTKSLLPPNLANQSRGFFIC